MGKTVKVSLKDLPAAIAAGAKDLEKKLEGAIDETGEESVGIVWRRVPFAFGELHNSVHYEKVRKTLVADAPHAAPVEVGAVPHMPPVAPLVAWATLRGMSDPERAAWAIAIKISKEGTKPHFYMRGSLPAIREELGKQIRKALGK